MTLCLLFIQVPNPRNMVMPRGGDKFVIIGKRNMRHEGAMQERLQAIVVQVPQLRFAVRTPREYQLLVATDSDAINVGGVSHQSTRRLYAMQVPNDRRIVGASRNDKVLIEVAQVTCSVW